MAVCPKPEFLLALKVSKSEVNKSNPPKNLRYYCNQKKIQNIKLINVKKQNKKNEHHHLTNIKKQNKKYQKKLPNHHYVTKRNFYNIYDHHSRRKNQKNIAVPSKNSRHISKMKRKHAVNQKSSSEFKTCLLLKYKPRIMKLLMYTIMVSAFVLCKSTRAPAGYAQMRYEGDDGYNSIVELPLLDNEEYENECIEHSVHYLLMKTKKRISAKKDEFYDSLRQEYTEEGFRNRSDNFVEKVRKEYTQYLCVEDLVENKVSTEKEAIENFVHKEQEGKIDNDTISKIKEKYRKYQKCFEKYTKNQICRKPAEISNIETDNECFIYSSILTKKYIEWYNPVFKLMLLENPIDPTKPEELKEFLNSLFVWPPNANLDEYIPDITFKYKRYLCVEKLADEIKDTECTELFNDLNNEYEEYKKCWNKYVEEKDVEIDKIEFDPGDMNCSIYSRIITKKYKDQLLKTLPAFNEKNQMHKLEKVCACAKIYFFLVLISSCFIGMEPLFWTLMKDGVGIFSTIYSILSQYQNVTENENIKIRKDHIIARYRSHQNERPWAIYIIYTSIFGATFFDFTKNPISWLLASRYCIMIKAFILLSFLHLIDIYIRYNEILFDPNSFQLLNTFSKLAIISYISGNIGLWITLLVPIKFNVLLMLNKKWPFMNQFIHILGSATCFISFNLSQFFSSLSLIYDSTNNFKEKTQGILRLIGSIYILYALIRFVLGKIAIYKYPYEWKVAMGLFLNSILWLNNIVMGEGQ